MDFRDVGASFDICRLLSTDLSTDTISWPPWPVNPLLKIGLLWECRRVLVF